MPKYLRLYNKNGELLKTSKNIEGNTGVITIENLFPETLYHEGDFLVSWVINGNELSKAPVPEFRTLELMDNKTIVVYFSDITEEQLIALKGDSAYKIALDNGFRGTQQDWLESLKGEPGEQGEPGKNGVDITEGGSAYEIALAEGFQGTREEWLESLKGEPGEPGEPGEKGDPGEDGFGVDGASAYEIALENGFVGNIQDFLDSLVGEPGRDGLDGNDGLSAYEIAKEYGYKGTEKDWLESLKPELPDTSDWQKHKLTENDGYMKELVSPDLARLDDHFNKTELVYVSTPRNSPHGVGYSGFINAIFRRGGYGIVEFQPYNSDSIYQNRRVGNRWEGWVEITNNQSDTGWISYQTINGVTSNTAFKNEGDNGFDCAYKTISNGITVTKKLRINGSNLTHGQVIAQLPTNFAKNTQSFPVQTSNLTNNAQVVIKPNGEVSFYVSDSDDSWNETDYVYDELTWHD